MKKIFLFITFIATTTLSNACTLRHSPTLHQILANFAHYHLITSKWHCGDLLQHSLWSCRSLAQWFDEEKFWVEELKPLHDLVILGGLLHDIGKAGDNVFLHLLKEDHPQVGSQYILNIKPFLLPSGEELDLSPLREELSISEEEQHMLAVILAMHLEFGYMMKAVETDGMETLDSACLEFLNTLHETCRTINFNKGIPTLQLLQALIAISVADIRGISPNSYTNTSLETLLGALTTQHTEACHPGINAYEKFDLEGFGKSVRQRLCELFTTKPLPHRGPALKKNYRRQEFHGWCC